MPNRGGSGRRLTYRERWEQLREWIASGDFELRYSDRVTYFGEHPVTARRRALLEQMDKLDHTTLVKARPARPRLTHTRKRARL
jgi:hypothetical protein